MEFVKKKESQLLLVIFDGSCCFVNIQHSVETFVVCLSINSCKLYAMTKRLWSKPKNRAHTGLTYQKRHCWPKFLERVSMLVMFRIGILDQESTCNASFVYYLVSYTVCTSFDLPQPDGAEVVRDCHSQI